MRNLQLRKRYCLPGEQSGQLLTASAWDGDSVICAYGPSENDALLLLKRWDPRSQGEEALQHIASFDALCPLPDLKHDKILSLYFLPEKSAVCLILAGGDLVLVREDPLPGEEKIEIVGSVEVGLTAAEWSPDGELLILSTRADTLLFMTRDLENSVTASLSEDDLKASKHVSVGWGKKETQFTGRGARALRDPTMPEKVDEGLKSTFDDDSTLISWRGDGQYFAVNSRQASSRRVIRIFSREGVLDGVSEPVDNLEAAVSWRPAGNLVASVQRHSGRLDVVFFERNGLRHGEYSLRPFTGQSEGDDPTNKITLKWNCDSSVLAVCFTDRIQLWTMGNYHYYLKQEIRTLASALISTSSNQHPVINWDPEQPLKFTWHHDNAAELLQFSSVVLRSSPQTSNSGTVAVIDGRILKLTALRYANVPPPMAQEELELEENVRSVDIIATDAGEQIAVLGENKAHVFIWNVGSKALSRPKLVGSVNLEISGRKFDYHSIKFLGQKAVTLLNTHAGNSHIQNFEIITSNHPETAGLSVDTLRPSNEETTTHEIASILPVLNKPRDTYLLSYSGELKRVSAALDGEDSAFNSDIRLPKETDYAEPCSLSRQSVTTGQLSSNGIANELLVFALSQNGSLYANDRLLAKDCTSFAVTPAHLVFTTSTHLLKFVHLVPAQELAIPADTPEADERCRAAERGAKIITVIPTTGAVVLQMPRGNLETIFPRALVLAGIRRAIDDRKYRKAFMMCRKQRVDMNMIFDYKPDQLLKDVGVFIDQVHKVEHIDLFLSQLRDENVAESMYKDTLPKAEVAKIDSNVNAVHGVAGKVNRICDMFLPALRERSSTNLQNIITAHVVKTPPDIEAGLLEVVKFLKMGEKEGERAIEHICFLVDVNRLYDNALGLYDLNLAVLIAEQSQKDPREYLPFLQRMQDLPDSRRQFAIDDHLDRYSKALADLWNLGDFDEYKQYAAKHELYADALAATRYEEKRYSEIMALFAVFLQNGARHKEAGVAFEYLGDHAAASECYRLAHMWRESLSNACMAEMSQTRLRELASAIIESSVEQKDFQAAAIISRDYLDDPHAAAGFFCRGYLFADAIALLSRRGQTAAIKETVDSSLMERMGATSELLADCRSQLAAQVPRIRELRIKKTEQPLAYYEGTNEGGTDIPDNISIAATDASTMGGTLFTRYTGKVSGTIATNATRKTAKNRRKEERKRAQGKKGSVYEEEYLVNSVGRLFERVNSVVDEVDRLVIGLMRRGMREQARAVETSMREVVQACEGCRDEVFQIEQTPRSQPLSVPDQGYSEPSETVETSGEGQQQQQQQQQILKTPPVLRKWEALSLLG